MDSFLAHEERLNRSWVEMNIELVFSKVEISKDKNAKGAFEKRAQKHNYKGKQCHFCKKYLHFKANSWEKAKQRTNFIKS